MFVPPELMGAHIGAPTAHTTGRTHTLGFRTVTALFGHMGVEWNLLDTDEATRAELAAAIALHKRFRPLLHTGDTVRFDPVNDGDAPSSLAYGVYSSDRTEALIAVVQLRTDISLTPPMLRLPGLDPDQSYRVAPRRPTAAESLDESPPARLDRCWNHSHRSSARRAWSATPIDEPRECRLAAPRDHGGHFLMLPVLGPIRPWTDPTITSIGRLPMHVPITRSQRRSLDGAWSFALFDHPDHVPESAITDDAPATTVTVPGSWTMQDTGDLPHYTNVQMPFAGPPPALPERVTTGVFRTNVTVPRSWKGSQIVLHVAGAESVHGVYVNGTFAGYGTDSRLPSEYDISTLAKTGANEICIVVIRYSALELHRGSGPMVDGRPAPLGAHRIATARAPRRCALRR